MRAAARGRNACRTARAMAPQELLSRASMDLTWLPDPETCSNRFTMPPRTREAPRACSIGVCQSERRARRVHASIESGSHGRVPRPLIRRFTISLPEEAHHGKQGSKALPRRHVCSRERGNCRHSHARSGMFESGMAVARIRGRALTRSRSAHRRFHCRAANVRLEKRRDPARRQELDSARASSASGSRGWRSHRH